MLRTKVLKICFDELLGAVVGGTGTVVISEVGDASVVVIFIDVVVELVNGSGVVVAEVGDAGQKSLHT